MHSLVAELNGECLHPDAAVGRLGVVGRGATRRAASMGEARRQRWQQWRFSASQRNTRPSVTRNFHSRLLAAQLPHRQPVSSITRSRRWSRGVPRRNTKLLAEPAIDDEVDGRLDGQ